MNVFKSLILGSAAGLVAMSGAQAADLPVKAKAVEYVRICSLYGAGFYYMPGTDTCIKFGGYLRADTAIRGGDYGFMYSSGAGNRGSNNSLSNYYDTRARFDFTVDTRTATEYGVVRTFADLVFSVDSATVAGSSPSTITNAGTAGLGIYHAFIQFAGFTFGRTTSYFDAPWTGYPAGGPDTNPGGSNMVTGVNLVAYTAEFGNGVSGSIALQEHTTAGGGQSNLWNVTAANAATLIQGQYGMNDWGGTRAPDIVSRVRVDQAWGLFQVSAIAHDLHAAYYGATEPTGRPSDKWGWAVQAALSIKNIPTGPGDSINMQAVYADGATHMTFGNISWPQNFSMYSGTGLAGAYQSVGFAGLADGIFAAGTGIETVKTWGFRGGYTHNWNPNWASAIYGGYAGLKYGDASKALICANFAVIAVAGSTCNPDFNVAVIGANVVWTPVRNLAFTADVVYTRLDQKYSGAVSGAGTAVANFAKPAAVYELKDQNSVSALLRAQRNF